MIETAISNFARGATNSANTANLGATSFRGLSGLDQRLLPLTTVQINQSFSQRTNCNVGGYHETSDQISGSIDTAPDSTSRLQLNAAQTIHDYACCTSSNQSGPLRLRRKRDFLPLCRVVRRPLILSPSCS